MLSKKSKVLSSLALSACLLAGTVVPAFAAETTTDTETGNTTTESEQIAAATESYLETGLVQLPSESVTGEALIWQEYLNNVWDKGIPDLGQDFWTETESYLITGIPDLSNSDEGIVAISETASTSSDTTTTKPYEAIVTVTDKDGSYVTDIKVKENGKTVYEKVKVSKKDTSNKDTSSSTKADKTRTTTSKTTKKSTKSDTASTDTTTDETTADTTDTATTDASSVETGKTSVDTAAALNPAAYVTAIAAVAGAALYLTGKKNK